MIAVRPPEYWPGLAFFAMMHRVERFVLADTFQYSRQSFQNRARLRNPQSWQWISVPLKGGQHGKAIRDVRIRSHLPWRGQHRRALLYNYGAAPFYAHYESIILDVLERDWNHLGELTCTTISVLRELLGIATPLIRASALPSAPASLAEVLITLGSGEILSPEAAAPHDVGSARLAHVFHYQHPPYAQPFAGFEPGMSVLDLLLMYGPEASTILKKGGRVIAYQKQHEHRPGSAVHSESEDEKP